MALVACPDCGRDVSTIALNCPQCGRPAPFGAPVEETVPQAAAAPLRSGNPTMLIVLVFVGLGAISVALGSVKPSAPRAASDPQTDSLEARLAQITDSARRLREHWQYSDHQDDMSSGRYRLAQKLSTNEFSFSSPYGGPQRASLTLRSHPRYGREVILSIERGQLLCQPIGQCVVAVRFDEAPARNFSVVEPADHSSNTLFIQNFPRFSTGLAKAKVVRISVPVYEEGEQTFTFDAAGFDVAKLK